MLRREVAVRLGVVVHGAHAEAQAAQVHTQVKLLARVSRSTVSVKQSRGGIKLGIPEELPVRNVIRRVAASRIAEVYDACHGIITYKYVFREPVAVEQMRWRSPNGCVCFEQLGCLVEVGA